MTTTTIGEGCMPDLICPDHFDDDAGPVYSVEPVVDRFVDIETAAQAIGVSERTLYRMLVSGLDWSTADRVACHLGMHPAAIWPSWFDDAVAADPGEDIFDQPTLPGVKP